jgi:sigma-B regulation protein RsbU (phosphoserine phosphatase)
MNMNVAVYVDDQALYDQLKAAADSTNLLLHHSPPLADFKDQVVICDVKSLEHKKGLKEHNKNTLYVISPNSDEDNMMLIQKHHLHHLVGLNENVFAQETIAHIVKQKDKAMWGLQPYMDKSAELKVISLSDSKFTNEMVQEALGHFDFQDYFTSPLEYIQVMANELISNSLYKGPNRRRQEQGLDTPDRKAPVFLKGSDLVQVTLSMDSKGVALSVQDSFGGLTYDLLMSSLLRSFQEKTAMDKKDGAGLGLYLTYLHSNQFIINFREKFRTEVICIIERNKRYKNYKQRIRSFHFFQEVPGEKTND